MNWSLIRGRLNLRTYAPLIAALIIITQRTSLLDISVTCSNCNYHSRVSPATVASNMFYCQNCGKQITGVLPRFNEEGTTRSAGARKPPARRPGNRSGGNRPGQRRR